MNSIDQHYPVLTATRGTSQEAAAAAAAATAMKTLVPDSATDIQAALTSYLAGLPDGTAKADGSSWGTEAAEAILQVRALR